jgi:hypothetical protein
MIAPIRYNPTDAELAEIAHGSRLFSLIGVGVLALVGLELTPLALALAHALAR